MGGGLSLERGNPIRGYIFKMEWFYLPQQLSTANSSNNAIICARILASFIFCGSYLGNLSCRVFKSATATFPQDGIPQHPSIPLALTLYLPLLPCCSLSFGMGFNTLLRAEHPVSWSQYFDRLLGFQ